MSQTWRYEWRHFRVNIPVLLGIQFVWLLGLIHWSSWIAGGVGLLSWFIWRYSKVHTAWFALHWRSLTRLLLNLHFRSQIWTLFAYKVVLDVALGWVLFNMDTGLSAGIVSLIHVMVDCLILLVSTTFLERNYYVLEYNRFLMLLINVLVFISIMIALYYSQQWTLPFGVSWGLGVSGVLLIFALYLFTHYDSRWNVLWLVLFGATFTTVAGLGLSELFITKPVFWMLPVLLYGYSVSVLEIGHHYASKRQYFVESTGLLAASVLLITLG